MEINKKNQEKKDIYEDFKFDVLNWNYYFNTHVLSLCYPLDNICVLSQHFNSVSMKSGVLHNEHGPAISYAGNWDIYVLNGVCVPEWLVKKAWNDIDSKLLLKEADAEVRREIVRKIGIEKICYDLSAKVIDGQADYELLLLDLGDGRRRPYLKMKNPSIGVFHIEGVHPDCQTVEQALNFRNKTVDRPSILT